MSHTSRKRLSQHPLRRLGSRGTAALVALSAALLIVGVGVYVGELPTLMSSPATHELPEDKGAGEKDAAPKGGVPSTDVPAPDSDGAPEGDAPSEEKPDEEKGAAEDEGELDLPNVSVDSAQVEGTSNAGHTGSEGGATSPETPQRPTPPMDGTQGGGSGGSQDTPQGGGSGGGTGSGSGGGSESGGGTGSGSGGGSGTESGGDSIFNATPTAEEEERFRAFLANKASLIPDYVNQVNGVVGSFESSCKTGSLSTRQAHLSTCSSLSQTLFSEYLDVLNYVRSNKSQYCNQQAALIGAYRSLCSYVSCYEDAWTVNVAYEDPSPYVSEFMAPLDGSDTHLAQFHSYYDGLSL